MGNWTFFVCLFVFIFLVSVQLYVCRINMFCERLVTRMVPCGSEKMCVYLKQVRRNDWEIQSASTGPHFRDLKPYGSELLRQFKNILRQSQFELKCHILCYYFTVATFHSFKCSFFNTALDSKRNYCYTFTIRSSVRVEKKSSCDPPLLFYVL